MLMLQNPNAEEGRSVKQELFNFFFSKEIIIGLVLAVVMMALTIFAVKMFPWHKRLEVLRWMGTLWIVLFSGCLCAWMGLKLTCFSLVGGGCLLLIYLFPFQFYKEIAWMIQTWIAYEVAVPLIIITQTAVIVAFGLKVSRFIESFLEKMTSQGNSAMGATVGIIIGGFFSHFWVWGG